MRDLEDIYSDASTDEINLPESKKVFEDILGYQPDFIILSLANIDQSAELLAKRIAKIENVGVPASLQIILEAKHNWKHSTALHIDPEKGVVKYCDSSGRPLPDELRTVLEARALEVNDLSTNQQESEQSCVIWTAKNLLTFEQAE